MGTLMAMKGITKTFPGVCALDRIDSDLSEGEVHLLLGESRIGESTLMKTLGDVCEPAEGTICIGDETFTSLTPQLLRQKDISIIYQKLSVVSELTVVENLFTGRLHMKKYYRCIPVMDWAKMIGQAKQVLEKIDFHKDAVTRASGLSISEEQLVEITKALLDNSKTLAMGEPTSFLSQEETRNLFKIMKELRAEDVGIIYVFHKMDEVREIGDRVTILKDGEPVKTMNMADVMDNKQITSLMVGRKLSRETMRRDDRTDLERAGVVPRVSHVVSGEYTVEDMGFELHRGGILGFTDLVGAGCTEPMNVIFGTKKMESGGVWLYGERVRIRSPYGAIKNGIVFTTENCQETGFFGDFDIRRNVMSMKILKAAETGGITGMIYKQEERWLAMKQKENLSIHCMDIRQPVVTLSGGSQQKVIVGKWLAFKADIVIFDKPIKGTDTGAKNEICHIMGNLADQGKSILMVPSELPGLLRMCDRILIFSEGHIRGEFSGGEATEQMTMSSAILQRGECTMKNTRKQRLSSYWNRFGAFTILVLPILVLALFGPPQLIAPSNLLQITIRSSITIIIACGRFLAILITDIDLSVDSIMALANMVIARLVAMESVPQGVAVLIGLLVGAMCGVFDGMLISVAKLHPSAVTLGTQPVFRGSVLIFSDAKSMHGFPQQSKDFTDGWLGGKVPSPVIIALIVVVLLWFLSSKTVLGWNIYTPGGNKETAWLSGTDMKLYILIVCIISGVYFGLAGVVCTARIGSVEPLAGQGCETLAITSAVIGGISLLGGREQIPTVVIGRLIISTISDGLSMLGVSSYYQWIMTGSLITIVVFPDRIFKGKASK